MVVELLIGCVAVAILGGVTWGIQHFSEEEKIKRTLRAASRWPIAELPESTQGRVVGRTRIVGATLTAPMSGRECAYYLVEVADTSGESEVRLFGELRALPFVIEDDTGRALVDPEGARITLEFDHVTVSGQDDPPTDDERALLKRHGRGDASTCAKSLIYREAVIAIGERVAVLGSGIREPDPDAMPSASYRGELPTRLRFASSARYPLVISDSYDTVGD